MFPFRWFPLSEHPDIPATWSALHLGCGAEGKVPQMFLLESSTGALVWAVPVVFVVLLGLLSVLIIKLDRRFGGKVTPVGCARVDCFGNHAHKVSLNALMGPKYLFSGHPHTHLLDNGKTLFHSHEAGHLPHLHPVGSATS